MDAREDLSILRRLRSGCGLSPGSIDRPLAASMRALQGAGGSQEIGRASRQKGHIVNAPCPNRGEVRLNVRCAGTRTGALDPLRSFTSDNCLP